MTDYPTLPVTEWLRLNRDELPPAVVARFEELQADEARLWDEIGAQMPANWRGSHNNIDEALSDCLQHVETEAYEAGKAEGVKEAREDTACTVRDMAADLTALLRGRPTKSELRAIVERLDTLAAELDGVA